MLRGLTSKLTYSRVEHSKTVGKPTRMKMQNDDHKTEGQAAVRCSVLLGVVRHIHHTITVSMDKRDIIIEVTNHPDHPGGDTQALLLRLPHADGKGCSKKT